MSNTKQRQSRRRITAALCLLAVAAALPLWMAAGGAPATRPAPAASSGATGGASAAEAQTHFDKAKTLYDEGRTADSQSDMTMALTRYAQAMNENDKALEADPTMQSAILLKALLQSKLGGAPGGGPVAATGPAGKLKLLTAQQVSVIRLMETHDEDMSIKGNIPRQALEDYWNNVYAKEPNADMSRNAHDSFLNPNNFASVAHNIKDSRDMNSIKQINVTTDPANMIYFSNTIHPYVLQNCATAQCHGGDNAGTFRLITSANTPEARYTNFYIMSEYVAHTANAGSRVLDRQNPERSLLIQYALPRATAKLPHPKVDTKKLTGPDDPRINGIMGWITSLQVPMPNYGIAYDLPGGAPPAPAATTTAPATSTAPATGPATRGGRRGG